MRKIGLLLVLTLILIFASQAVPAAELITNGGFESGNFTGWTATNATGGFENWTVSGSGFGFVDSPLPVATQVIEGSFNAWNTVAASAGGTYMLARDVTIPAGNVAIFRWKHRYQMNLSTYCSGAACGTATFTVEILNTSNVLLQTLHTVVTNGSSNTNTGWTSNVANLSAYGGQTIRIRFRTTVTVSLAGPGRLEVDGVSLQAFLPSAAEVTVGGQVMTAGGSGIAGATVTLIDPAGNPRTTRADQFGYYQFDEVETDNTYVLTAKAKGMAFVDSPMIISVNDNMLNLDFHATM